MAGLLCCAGFLRFVFGLRLKRGHGERLPVRGAGAGPCSLPGITSLRRVLRAMTFCRNSSERGCQPQAVQAVCGGVRGLTRVAVVFGLESEAVDVRDELYPVAVNLAFQLFAFGFAVLICHRSDADLCTSSWTRGRPALVVTGPGYPWWRLPAHVPASADELCSPGGAGAQPQRCAAASAGCSTWAQPGGRPLSTPWRLRRAGTSALGL